MAKFTAKGYSAALVSLLSVPAKIAKPIAKDIGKAIERQFDAGTDPYGRPWAPLRPATLAKGRTPPPLTATRAGRDSIQVKPGQGAGVMITVGKSYMGIHQDGAPPRLVARKILPEGKLPPSWKLIYQTALSKAVKAGLSGK